MTNNWERIWKDLALWADLVKPQIPVVSVLDVQTRNQTRHLPDPEECEEAAVPNEGLRGLWINHRTLQMCNFIVCLLTVVESTTSQMCDWVATGDPLCATEKWSAWLVQNLTEHLLCMLHWPKSVLALSPSAIRPLCCSVTLSCVLGEVQLVVVTWLAADLYRGH
jgi:hypothetical protein